MLDDHQALGARIVHLTLRASRHAQVPALSVARAAARDVRPPTHAEHINAFQVIARIQLPDLELEVAQ